ncbi:unnamed protein product [Adineta ricciae]|uniref:Uncharacterized protein n=1 Tax=Adineta ricciae TaxID=249248 RepID=A0A814U848_ADIRI|nr:unnamed protein product [Adineta ricciae]CAF1170390.1 unnamed protein product [Adineta ricciae]
MSLERVPSTTSHFEQEESQNSNSQVTIELDEKMPNENNVNRLTKLQKLPSITEQQNSVESFSTPSTPGYAREDQHRTRRRSSVQILDKKFIQLLPSQMTSSFIGNNESYTRGNVSDCEL